MESECCRLCGYNSSDLIGIFSEQGIVAEYARKIGRYLYLLVTPSDNLPKAVCWMCSQQLDSFHRFHEKINEIQQRTLKERYPEFVIEAHHKYVDDGLIEIFEHTVEEEDLPVESDHQKITELIQVDEAEPEEEKENNIEIELAIELIPNSNNEDSFLVVKTDMPAEEERPTMQQGSQIHNAESSSSETEVFEIRKSTRTKRIGQSIVKNKKCSDEEESDEEEILLEQKTVRKRSGRKRVKKLLSESEAEGHDEKLNEGKVALRKSPRKKIQEETSIDKLEQDEEEHSEGDSGDDFPARDSDNEEWPSAETMDKFPTTILKDGLLTIKGKQLMDMINRFYNVQCDVCKDRKDKAVRFKTLRELFDHYESDHDQKGYVTCCQTKIHRFPSIIMHMARHVQPEAFKCDICGYLVTRPRFLITHRQTHLPEDQKPYSCEHCPKRFCWKRAYQIHLNSHKSPEDRIVYVCSVCGKTYDTPGGLSAHKRNVHLAPSTQNSKVSHVCEVCAKTFAHASGLKEHMDNIHQPREKALVQCSECSKWLMNARCLKVHMQLHKKDDIACDMCDYKTKKNSLLKRHKITHHQNERPFSCEKCNHSFKHRQALTVHMRVKHRGGEKPSYKCNFCDRSFKSSTNFYTHRKYRHPEELAAMKEQAEAEKKLQRIRAGVEPDDIPLAQESTITTTADGTRIITISSRNYGTDDPMGTMIVLDITEGP